MLRLRKQALQLRVLLGTRSIVDAARLSKGEVSLDTRDIPPNDIFHLTIGHTPWLSYAVLTHLRIDLRTYSVHVPGIA